jgi:hypothetical protein
MRRRGLPMIGLALLLAATGCEPGPVEPPPRARESFAPKASYNEPMPAPPPKGTVLIVADSLKYPEAKTFGGAPLVFEGRWTVVAPELYTAQIVEPGAGVVGIGDVTADLYKMVNGSEFFHIELRVTARPDPERDGVVDVAVRGIFTSVGRTIRSGSAWSTAVPNESKPFTLDGAKAVKAAPAEQLVKVLARDETEIRRPGSIPLIELEFTAEDGARTVKTIRFEVRGEGEGRAEDKDVDEGHAP